MCTTLFDVNNCLLFCKGKTAAMPGRGGKGGAGLKPKKHFKAKQQKKRVFRSKDPILAVLMWGVQHSVRYYYNIHYV